MANGSAIRDEVRLVKDHAGTWSWFFGRDRAFVEEQSARYGDADETAPSGSTTPSVAAAAMPLPAYMITAT